MTRPPNGWPAGSPAALDWNGGASTPTKDSSTDVPPPGLRRAFLVHSLLSYLFGTFIIGLTINALAGLFG